MPSCGWMAAAARGTAAVAHGNDGSRLGTGAAGRESWPGYPRSAVAVGEGGLWEPGAAAQFSPGRRRDWVSESSGGQPCPRRSRVLAPAGPGPAQRGTSLGKTRGAEPGRAASAGSRVPARRDRRLRAARSRLPAGSPGRRPPGAARLCGSLPGERRCAAAAAGESRAGSSVSAGRSGESFRNLSFGRRCRGKLWAPGGGPAACPPRDARRGDVSPLSPAGAGRGLRGHSGTWTLEGN